MLPLKVNNDLVIRLLEPEHAEAFFDLLTRNRQHLDPWMMWTGRVNTMEDVYAMFERMKARHDANNGFHGGLWYQDQLAGGFAVREIDRNSNTAEIGYWLAQEFVGKGLVTKACVAVINLLITQEKVHRIEIQCATDNAPSRAVAERLGFTLEGIKRESEIIQGQYRDHCLYSLLDREWVVSPFASVQR